MVFSKIMQNLVSALPLFLPEPATNNAPEARMAIWIDDLVAVRTFDRSRVYTGVPLNVQRGKSLAAIRASNRDCSSKHNWFF